MQKIKSMYSLFYGKHFCIPYLTKTCNLVEGSLQSSFCGPPPTLSNAYYEIANNTATYLCQKGYTANQTDNVISCLQEQWEEPSLSCLGMIIGTPRCHPFLKLFLWSINESSVLPCNLGKVAKHSWFKKNTVIYLNCFN